MQLLPRNAKVVMFLCASLVIQFVFSMLLALIPGVVEAGYLVQTLLIYLFVYLIPILVFLRLTRWPAREVFPLGHFRLRNLIVALAIAFAVQPLMSFLSAFGLFFTANRAAEMISQAASPLWQTLIALALLPALCEELVYRGIVFSGFRNTSLKTAIIMNGLLFGLMHLNMQQFFYAFAMGIVFALIAYLTKSILYPFLCHLTINGVQIGVYYWSLTQQTQETVTTQVGYDLVIETLAQLAIPAIISAAVLVFLLRLLRHLNPPPVSTGIESEAALDYRPLPGTEERVVHPPLIALLLCFILFALLVS